MSKHALEVSALPIAELSPASAAPDAESAPRRPANMRRSFFHVASGLFALSVLHLLPTRTWVIAAAIAFAVFAWTCETLRRRSPAVNARLMRIFAPIAHANEHHEVNSSTWYITALLLLALFAPLRAAEIGVIVLAFADPAAGFVGRRWGRTRIRSGRSLEGTLAFVVAGTIPAAAWLAGLGVAAAPAVIVAAAGAIVGAIAEIAVTRVDDNFAIPVAATTAAAVAQMLV
ncbi:phytol kinase [Minicystis rosea]|nr:phytol kinase [Minicystis rosea]